jgi:hypothetical protein
MLALLLLLLDTPSSSVRTVRTIDSTSLSAQQARPLLGKRVHYRVELDSPAMPYDGWLLFDCRSSPPTRAASPSSKAK